MCEYICIEKRQVIGLLLAITSSFAVGYRGRSNEKADTLWGELQRRREKKKIRARDDRLCVAREHANGLEFPPR